MHMARFSRKLYSQVKKQAKASVKEITKDINKPNIKIITGKNLEAKITLSIALIALYLLK